MQGFIPGSRASFTLDLVATSLVVVVPALTLALRYAKRRDYAAHKRVQLAISLALLAVLTLFEIEMRLYGWEERAAASAYYDTYLWPVLRLHLTVAVTTTALWTITIFLALRRFARPPRPGAHSRLHKALGWGAALGIYLTTVTGWTFYWIAFLA
jgi:uncharacterized membrane protein YozB (DUF420 family)